MMSRAILGVNLAQVHGHERCWGKQGKIPWTCVRMVEMYSFKLSSFVINIGIPYFLTILPDQLVLLLSCPAVTYLKSSEG